MIFMEHFGPYSWIIAASAIILLSFLFGTIARKTSVPSVLLLISLGIGIQYLLEYLGVENPDFFSALEILGIIGLIMIVLEATLDLKLKREKFGLIAKSFILGLLGLGGSVAAGSAILFYLIPGLSWPQSLLYATPLSILSSAIVIPSVVNLPDDKREFHIYESTFSDIIGIMLFYFLIALFDSDSTLIAGGVSNDPYWDFGKNLIITIIISVVASYILLVIFQNIKEKAKLFVLISVLLLLYALAKEYHLSPLIIILIFGLAVSNSKLFFWGPLRKMLHVAKFKEMEEDLHSLTAETAFVVRTFFFVFFGLSIMLSSLVSLDVLLVSGAIVISIFLIRIVLMGLFIGKSIVPQIWIAPRGLITVLLFYAIPVNYQTDLFDPGILLFIIIATSVVMTFGMIGFRLLQEDEDEESDSQLLAQNPIPGTVFTPTIDPDNSLVKEWMAKVRNRIISNPRFKSTRRSSLRFFLSSAKALGVDPDFSRENKNIKRRLKNLFALIQRPGKTSIKEHRDYKALKRYIYRIIFQTNTLEGVLFDIFILILILISVAIVMIQSVGGIPRVWEGVLLGLEWVLTIIFSIEYALRVWTSEKSKKYIFSFYGLVDLMAILPLFLELIFTGVYSLGVIRIFRLLRIFRVLKLVQFMGEAQVLVRGLLANINKIIIFLFFIIIVSTVMGSVMFVIEGPEHGFNSIPRGVYWAVVTLTTVGYGDIHPSTAWGQFIAMILMVLGYAVIAVPTGLVAAGVASSMKKKKRVMLTCSNCKDKKQYENSKYCSHCGYQLQQSDC